METRNCFRGLRPQPPAAVRSGEGEGGGRGAASPRVLVRWGAGEGSRRGLERAERSTARRLRPRESTAARRAGRAIAEGVGSGKPAAIDREMGVG